MRYTGIRRPSTKLACIYMLTYLKIFNCLEVFYFKMSPRDHLMLFIKNVFGIGTLIIFKNLIFGTRDL